MNKEYPKYNEKELDDLSKRKFDKIQSEIEGYFSIGLPEQEGLTTDQKEIMAYNIAFIVLTSK